VIFSRGIKTKVFGLPLLAGEGGGEVGKYCEKTNPPKSPYQGTFLQRNYYYFPDPVGVFGEYDLESS